MTWRISGAARLLERTWDDERVIWSELTGQTHLLDLLSGTVLQLLQERPADTKELTERAAEELALHADSKLLTTVEQTLADFERLGVSEQN
jgi:PqqD family protein of HPr-rel-A system